MSDLDTPSVVVVGVGRGLGRAVARAYGHLGFRVALVARTRSVVEEIASDLRALGVDAASFPADVTSDSSVSAAFTDLRRWCDDALRTVIFCPRNVADVFGRDVVSAPAATVANTTPQVDLLFLGALRVAHETLPGFIERGRGAFGTVTASAAREVVPAAANFGAASAALRYWTLALHETLRGSGVRACTFDIGVAIDSEPGTEASAVAQDLVQHVEFGSACSRSFPPI